MAADQARQALFRSLRPDFIETSSTLSWTVATISALFRSPRPDFIETRGAVELQETVNGIVPVSKTGLH